MPNLYSAEPEPRGGPGFRVGRAALGAAAGAQRLGMSLWEVPPGEAAYPYHAHLGEEELLLVLEGTPSLRTPNGTRQLERGEVVSFLPGEQGAHQLVNRTDEPVTFIAISTSGEPDIVLYPDAGKVGVAERRGSGFRKFFRLEDERDYWDREVPPPDPAPPG